MAADLGLTDGQLTALRNLARKHGGDEVNWINIADARALTELGLAERGRGGWDITPQGLIVAADEGAAKPPPPTNNVGPLRRP